jgi:hypothetical protein
MKFISNAFSLQMIREPNCLMSKHELELDEFQALAYGAHSVVGHKDIAKILDVKYNRESILLDRDDVLLVAQITGGRLPEGTTELPEDVELKFYCIRILDVQI